MSKFVIISTYPTGGSRNIGDALITQSLVNLLHDVCAVAPEIIVVWRGAAWEDVRGALRAADHIIFACLAIRSSLGANVYPYAARILQERLPFSVISAGTDLRVGEGGSLVPGIDAESVDLLRELSARSQVFTTRGVLTQYLCQQLELEKCSLDGDIAFYGAFAFRANMRLPETISSIAISDPHRSARYLASLDTLVQGLSVEFPQARICMLLHGINPEVKDYCRVNGIDAKEIYENPAGGLDEYKHFDMHVGYRVHGHVSALKCGIPSYLLEQDGRGADYGATLSRRISVPNYLSWETARAIGESEPTASVVGPESLLAIIRDDARRGFVRFAGIEVELQEFCDRSRLTVASIVAGL